MRNLTTIMVLLTILTSCHNKSQQAVLSSSSSSTVVDSIDSGTAAKVTISTSDTVKPTTKAKDDNLVYFFESDTLKQNVEVKTLSDSTIRFLLISENKINGKIAKIQGVAKSMTHVDPEIDDDEEGNAYPAKEFIYNDKCILHIRIDMLQKDKLIVKEGGCAMLHDSSCPFKSLGILRKRVDEKN